mmetsp:Transcript_109833/g.310443  ORF Transcript_109833/g.310443 Transcript_109833/m.310443 type:complete len:140 (-) Transcript_109833:245-664(-)
MPWTRPPTEASQIPMVSKRGAAAAVTKAQEGQANAKGIGQPRCEGQEIMSEPEPPTKGVSAAAARVQRLPAARIQVGALVSVRSSVIGKENATSCKHGSRSRTRGRQIQACLSHNRWQHCGQEAVEEAKPDPGQEDQPP